MSEGPMQQVLEAAQSAEYCQTKDLETKDLEAKQKAAQEEDGWTHVHRGRRPIIPAVDPQPLADELETIAAKLLTLKRKEPLAEDTTVTSLTPLELMVRIVARKKYPTSLSEYSDNLPDLSLNTMYDDLFPIEPHPETHCPGLPKILFVGIPCGLEKSPDKHIITTTPDCWPIFSELYEWGKRARKSRIGDDEIALVTQRTTTFYDNTRSSAEKKLRQYTEDQIQRLPRDSQSEIQRLRKQIEDDCQKLRERNSSETRRHRLEGIADVRRKGLNFDYQDIQGSAFRYPGWRFYTRCYKCQAFYSFQVPDEIKAKESLDYYILRDVEYPPHSVQRYLRMLSVEESLNHRALPIPL